MKRLSEKEIQAMLASVVKRLVTRFGAEKIVLFGSYVKDLNKNSGLHSNAALLWSCCRILRPPGQAGFSKNSGFSKILKAVIPLPAAWKNPKKDPSVQ